MSLTLNDEQERALREWFATADKVTGWPEVNRLHGAIAPLMKPWRVEYYELTAKIMGPNGIEVGVDYLSRGIADRICRVLNGEERW